MSLTPIAAMEIASTPEEMEQYGRQLAAELPHSALIILSGELGAGKTTLMKGLAEGWGVAHPEEVTSPTYTLIHEYHRGERRLYHLDLYRIDTGAQLATLGLEDLLSPTSPGERKLIAVEWGEKLEAHWPRPYLRVTIAVSADERRSVRPEWVE